MNDGTDDIVARLRKATVPRLEMGWPVPHVVQRNEPLWLEAAAEIERLRNLCSEHRSQAMTFYAELVRLKQQQRADGK